MTEPSPLPPRLRDTRSLSDRVRQDRQNAKQLGVGFMGGRYAPIRPLGASALFGDLEDDELEDDLLAFLNTDRATASVAGIITLTLTYEPVEGSLHIRCSGVDQPPTEWTLNGQVVTFVNSHVHVGDVLTAAYAYYPSDIEELPGPGAWYRFDEASGSLMADSSGNGHDGSYTAVGYNQTSLLASDPDPAAYWNGLTSHSIVPYGAWMDTPEVSATILCMGGSGTLIARDSFVNGKLWALRIDPFLGGDLCLTYGGVFTGTTIATTGHNLADGAKHMAGFSYDGSTLELYIDGVLAQTASVSFSTIGTNVDLTFGAARSGSGDSYVDLYTGVLDEARIFDRALAASEHAAAWTEATT